MGGKSSTETAQTQQTTPTIGGGLLGGVLAKAQQINPDLTRTETNALDRLSANAAAGNPFAPAIGGVANTLLAGGGPDRSGTINNAYQQYQQQLSPYLQASYLDPRSAPGFGDALSGLNSDITSQINGMFAGAGRDLSGMNVQSLARGLAQGQGQLLANQYNQNVANQLNAANSLYGAGNTTAGLLSGLDQTRVNNQVAGINAADAANTAANWGAMQQLAIEAQRRGIPLQTLAAQFGMAMPAAQAFATQTGNSTSTKQMSGAEQFNLLAGGAGKLFGKG